MSPAQLAHILEQHRRWVTSGFTDTEGAGRADLSDVDLEGRDLGGRHLQRAILSGADLHQANLREADLADVDLRTVTGLTPGQLGGANLRGAELPEGVRFEGLAYVEESSTNTKTVFFTILSACAYSGLAIYSTTDAQLLSNTASFKLPIISTDVPVVPFFHAVPAFLLAIYVYFHLYLQRLLEALADLPAIFPDGTPLDRRAHPWLLNGLVRSHFRFLRESRPPLSHLQTAMSVLLARYTVPITIALFWLNYLRRHDWVGVVFQVVPLVLGIGCAVWFQRLAGDAFRGAPGPRHTAGVTEGRGGRGWPVVRKAGAPVGFALLTAFLALVVSDGAINGVPPEEESSGRCRVSPLLHRQLVPCWMHRVGRYVGARAFADLTEAEVSTKPANWARDGERPELVAGARLRGGDLRYARAVGAFLVSADLRGARLQGADLRDAQLQGADFRGARLNGANLTGANLTTAALGLRKPEEPDEFGTDLQGATLIRARLQRAKLGKSKLRGADLTEAQLKGAFLYKADLTGATLFKACLERADLSFANLSGAMLQYASLQAVGLEGATLRGTVLGGALLTEARLGRADLTGAMLSLADLEDADLRDTTGVTASQVRTATNWQLARYDPELLPGLGLPPDHNRRLETRRRAPRQPSSPSGSLACEP